MYFKDVVGFFGTGYINIFYGLYQYVIRQFELI